MKRIAPLLCLALCLLTTACKKDITTDLILGDWYNTSESYQVVDYGAQLALTSGVVSMTITTDSIFYFDGRCDCIPTWMAYQLTEEAHHTYLDIDYPYTNHPRWEITKLTSNSMVLTYKYCGNTEEVLYMERTLPLLPDIE